MLSTNMQHRNSTNIIPKILQVQHKQEKKKMFQVINISYERHFCYM